MYSNMAYFPGEHFLYFLLNILNIVNLKYLIRSFVQLNRWSNKNVGLVKKNGSLFSFVFKNDIFYFSKGYNSSNAHCSLIFLGKFCSF